MYLPCVRRRPRSGSGAAAALHQARQEPEADTAGDHRGGADQQERGLRRTGLGELLAVALRGRVAVRAGLGQRRGALLLRDGVVAAAVGGGAAGGAAVAAAVTAGGAAVATGGAAVTAGGTTVTAGGTTVVATVATGGTTVAAAGLITAGLVTPGLVTPGLITAGLVTPGLITAGLITAGLVTPGLAAVLALTDADDVARVGRVFVAHGRDRLDAGAADAGADTEVEGRGRARGGQRGAGGDHGTGRDARDTNPRLLRHMVATPSS
ncbi:hypothetical protein CG719_16165 [Streptomyces sp. CB01373]|nr:hypothetical protein CG719_16165 [Streptomyces sp. CB01373]